MLKQSSRGVLFACVRFCGVQNCIWQIINKFIHPILVVFGSLVATVIEDFLFYFANKG